MNAAFRPGFVGSGLALLALLGACNEDPVPAEAPTTTPPASESEPGSESVVESESDPEATLAPPPEGDYHAVEASWAVESDATVGRFVTGVTRIDPIDFDAGAADTLAYRVACLALARATPGDPASIDTAAGCPEETRTYDFTDDGGTLTVEVAAATVPMFLDEHEAHDAFDLALHRPPQRDEVLVGTATNAYTQPGEDWEGQVVRQLFAIQKSTDLDPTDVDGPWGAVRVAVDLAKDDARATVGSYVTDFQSATGEITVSSSVGREILQPLDGSTATVEDIGSTNLVDLPFAVTSDGTLTLAATGPRGAISPSADFLFILGADPPVDEPASGEADTAQTQLVLGVRRDTAPDLQGHTYAITYTDLWVEAGRFEVAHAQPGATLTFDDSEPEATLALDLAQWSTTFAGVADDDVDVESLVLDLATDPSGQITLTFEDGGDHFELVGFAQEGGHLLALGAFADQGDRGSVGLALGICTTCDAE